MPPVSIYAPYSGLNHRSAKRFLARQFREAGLPFPDEDALDLLLGLTGLSHADYVARGTDFVSAETFDALRRAADRRLAGEPVDRILGWREFDGRRFAIDNVLSPRGDTEVLLRAARQAVRDVPDARLLELGTGSGALAVSLLAERPDCRVTATDLSEDALRTAKRNADAHGVEDRLSLVRSDWFESLPGSARFDAVLSNPPYITTDAMARLSSEVADHDPHLALHGGADGLDPYRVIIPGARERLMPEGWLGVEIGFDQGSPVSTLMRGSGFQDVSVLQDPAGLDRVVCGQAPSA